MSWGTDDGAAVGQAREHGTEWSAIARATGLDAATAERLWGVPSPDRTTSS